MPTPAANNIQIHEKYPNSGKDSSPPSLIFPNGDTINESKIKVKKAIEAVNKVSNCATTKTLILVSKSPEASGKRRTIQEKNIAKPELMKNTGKLISSPRKFLFLLINSEEVFILLFCTCLFIYQI